jgi:hypothetical protein
VYKRNQNRDQTASATCETAFDHVHQMANLSLSFVDLFPFPRRFPRTTQIDLNFSITNQLSINEL